MDLFTYAAQAEQAARDGIERSARTAGDEWHTAALAAVETYLRSNRYLHVDELWKHLPEQPEGQESKRALGKVIRAAARDGWITKAYPLAERGLPPGAVICMPSVSSRGGAKQLWVSQLWQRGAA